MLLVMRLFLKMNLMLICDLIVLLSVLYNYFLNYFYLNLECPMYIVSPSVYSCVCVFVFYRRSEEDTNEQILKSTLMKKNIQSTRNSKTLMKKISICSIMILLRRIFFEDEYDVGF